MIDRRSDQSLRGIYHFCPTNKPDRSVDLPAEKNNRHHHKISNGFTGNNGTCIGFNGNCNGPCGSLLVIGHFLLVAC